jgi:hypothetical protein
LSLPLSRPPRLIQDAPPEALDFVVFFLFNVFVLGLMTLALWACGVTPLAARLAKAYAVLWGAVCFAHMALMMIQAILRVDIYSHPDMFLYSNMAVGFLLLPPWAAYAALEARAFAEGRPLWTAAVIYFVGFFASAISWKVVCTIYRGYFYQMTFVWVALVSYLLFALWPAGGQTLFGWLFNLF